MAGDATKRIPSLAEWLDGSRGEGFEDWVGRSLMVEAAVDGPSAQFMRLMKTFMVACVEQMNREAAIDPSPEAAGAAIALWSRAAGFTTLMAIASVARDDAPLRRFARVYAEEFKIGAKLAVDQLEASHADR